MAKIGEAKDSVKVAMNLTKINVKDREPVMVSLGCHIDGVALPHPDPKDPQTVLAGSLKRFAAAPPEPNRRLRRRFRRFVQSWVKRNVRPLACDTDVSFEKWIEGRPYPLARKNELREVYEKYGGKVTRVVAKVVKSFMKMEPYNILEGPIEYKHARAINSRLDAFKVVIGPYISAIEQVLYEMPQFIKHVPVRDRGAYVMDYIGKSDAIYFSTDYTAFESLFTKELMFDCEMILYKHCLQFLPCGSELYKLLAKVLAGTNCCYFRGFSLKLLATRMSGEMTTSLGNGFSNLMFMLFLCSENGCSDVRMCVEGDDGIGRITGGHLPTAQQFEELGLRIKLEIHKRLSHASFCGLVFDEEDKIVVSDPLDALMSFGWTTNRYLHSRSSTLRTLLRCKALSLAHQYPGCPIISSLAHYGLRVTSGHDIRRVVNRRVLNNWERDNLLLAVQDDRTMERVAVPVNTRFLVEDLYNIKYEDQVLAESYLDSLDVIAPLVLPPCLQDRLNDRKTCVDYFDRYHDTVVISSDPARFVGVRNPVRVGSRFVFPGFSDIGPSNFSDLVR